MKKGLLDFSKSSLNERGESGVATTGVYSLMYLTDVSFLRLRPPVQPGVNTKSWYCCSGHKKRTILSNSPFALVAGEGFEPPTFGL